MAGKLNPDALKVESFATMSPVGYNAAAAGDAITAPQTWEKWLDSCCYICYRTGPTMCDWCSTNPPVYPPSDPAICPITVAAA
ncbi:MAG TPA: hypothetical protein VF092_10150 [Longimicrobium sp.]